MSTDPATAESAAAEETTLTAPPSSGVTAASLEQKLTAALGATHCAVADLSGGCGQMFEATIVAPAFAGKRSTLARHRLVNAALRAEIAAIHAWTPRCFTPEEWAARVGAEEEGGR